MIEDINKEESVSITESLSENFENNLNQIYMCLEAIPMLQLSFQDQIFEKFQCPSLSLISCIRFLNKYLSMFICSGHPRT